MVTGMTDAGIAAAQHALDEIMATATAVSLRRVPLGFYTAEVDLPEQITAPIGAVIPVVAGQRRYVLVVPDGEPFGPYGAAVHGPGDVLLVCGPIVWIGAGGEHAVDLDGFKLQ